MNRRNRFRPRCCSSTREEITVSAILHEMLCVQKEMQEAMDGRERPTTMLTEIIREGIEAGEMRSGLPLGYITDGMIDGRKKRETQ